jgi:SAM-dependent methyltransferase
MNARVDDFAPWASDPQFSGLFSTPLTDAKLQRRAQRGGWDLAARDYESLWQAQLAPARRALLGGIAVRAGERVLDAACGTGLVTFEAARSAGPAGRVLGTDISARMVHGGRQSAARRGITNVDFARMDAERLTLSDGVFDVALCALGLMYLPDPARALGELRRVLRPGGRVGLAVWGARVRCGWAGVFPVVQAEVGSEICPLFFRLGESGALAGLCGGAGLSDVREQRIAATLIYEDGPQACESAFTGGPVALAWSRFDERTRARVTARYLRSIEPWRCGEGYRIPGEFLVAHAEAP